MKIQQMESFGGFIRKLREQTKQPIRKIAAQLDIDSSLLGKIERNERQPTKEVIEKIAKIFNQDLQELTNKFLSDQIAYKIVNENADIEVLKVAEKKIKYLTNKKI